MMMMTMTMMILGLWPASVPAGLGAKDCIPKNDTSEIIADLQWHSPMDVQWHLPTGFHFVNGVIHKPGSFFLSPKSSP